MPAPLTYIDITSTPFSQLVAQADFTAGTYGGVANEVWCRYVAAAQVDLGGYIARSAAVFIPRTRIYASDGSTLLHTVLNPSSKSYAWNFVFSAGTYYLRITNVGSAAPAAGFDFTVEADTASILTTIPDGSLLINDDSTGYPSVVVQTDGTVSGIVTQIPGGENGDSLPTGEMLWHDTFNDPVGQTRLKLFDATAVLASTIDLPFSVSFALICHDASKFWVALGTHVYSIETDGTYTNVATLAHSNASAIGANLDGTILYYARGVTAGGTIYRWDLVNNVALSALYSVPGFTPANGDSVALTGANGNPGEILGLSDGSVVTFYYKGLDDTYHVLHLSATGTALANYDFGTTSYWIIDHIHYSLDNPNSIRVWLYKDYNAKQARYVTLELADGSTTTTFDTDMFSQGVNTNADSDIKFAPSNSCAMVTAGGYPSPVAPVSDDLFSEPCCPCDCPPTPVKDGTPTRSPLPTHTGPILPPIDLTWDRNCTGGGTVPTAADPTDVESWVS